MYIDKLIVSNYSEVVNFYGEVILAVSRNIVAVYASSLTTHFKGLNNDNLVVCARHYNSFGRNVLAV